jgi:2-hydroxychromene-2-carboxylate isomerase
MSAREAIDFYFDFASPYGYFMSEKITPLAQHYGREVRWRPILLFAVLRAHGLAGPLEHPIKRDYMVNDFARSAALLGIDYRLPAVFPVLTQHAARAFYLLEKHVPEAAVPFAHSVLRSYLADGNDISDLDRISGLAEKASGGFWPAARIADLVRADDAKADLQAAIQHAVEQRVFGSPFVIADGEGFFGVDRLPHLEAKLARGQ